MPKSRTKDRHIKSIERSEYVKTFQGEKYDRVSILIRKDSGIMEGLQKAVENGYTRNGYIIEAIRRMLQFDDFMPED